MAGLSAAWRLSRPGGPEVSVTVYQRGWRLGGKGASSRGVYGRIQEHGLHVWPGYYDNAFRLVRSCYDELDRPHRDPACPIREWKDAFVPASAVGLGEERTDGWTQWIATFPENDLVPGDGDDASAGLDPAQFLRQASALIARFGESIGERTPPARAVLSTRRQPPDHGGFVGGAVPRDLFAATGRRRASQLAGLLVTMIRGVVADQLLTRGYTAIDDLDFREWLAGHGASQATLDGPLVRGMYDLVFGYEQGDHLRPRFSAGLALHLSARLFLTYRGAIFWKMRAGMGDVIFAPLYEALSARGVHFEFFHRLDNLHLSADGCSIGAVTLGRQVALSAGRAEYNPLTRVRSLPVFPDTPDLGQLGAGADVAGQDLESHWCTWPDAGPVRLEVGRDYDAVVLAVSLGMIPHVCGELIDRDPRWRAMTEQVSTVATQACQVWLRQDERALGWRDKAVVLTGCGEPFDTFASMSQTLPFEDWPEDQQPVTAASFCAVLPDSDLAHPKGADAHADDTIVRDNAMRFLDDRIARLWPAAVQNGEFRWDLLSGDVDATGRERFSSQYWRANTDPSDRYVQSLPGTGRFRLAADASGFDNLFLAGDWIDSGLNAGCIEAAVLAGVQAANAVEGRPLVDATVGFRPVTETAS
jgi:uncharacterized protein with NAD-binding domain and iron-sulfur cluster